MMNFVSPHLTYGKRPIICLGQSNIAGGYEQITTWPAARQSNQPGVGWSYRLYCHPGLWAQNNTVIELGPWQMGTSTDPQTGSSPVSGPLMGSWLIDLGYQMFRAGANPALIAYCIGGAVLNRFVPEVFDSHYSDDMLPFIQQALAQLPMHLEPVVVMYQGESGYETGITSWDEGCGAMMTGLRTDLGYPNMPIVVVRIPQTYLDDNPDNAVLQAEAAEQIVYVQNDPYSALARDDLATFITLPGPPNLHIDQASGARLANSVFQGILGLI